ncbi:MAG TPA: transposase [Armatimonadota bacterium]|nr:transposase [Armatimonadota bacterium]
MPHWEREGAAYFVTFRLAGTLPAAIAEQWRREREHLHMDEPGSDESRQRARALHARFDVQLDQGECGPRFLAVPEVAEMLCSAVEYFRDERYDLLAYVVMPNHVHLMLRPLFNGATGRVWALDALMHSLKSYSAHRANRMLRQTGAFWQREYYDHVIRDDDECAWYADYTLRNPVAARLCDEPEQWPWSNARAVYGGLNSHSVR